MKRTKSEIKEKDPLDTSPKRRRTSKAAAEKAVEEDKAEESGGAEETPASPTKGKAQGSADDRASHIRDVVRPFPLRDEFDYLKVISWNVNGLNALVSSKKHVLDQLIHNHAPDVMFLQETKIQEPMEGDYADLVPGYHAIFSSSTVKKGYSGTCVLLKKARLGLDSLASDAANAIADTAAPAKKKPQQKKLSAFFGGPAASSKETTDDSSLKTEAPQNALTEVIRVDRHFPDPADSTRRVCDGEGRILTVELADCFLVGVYVPNSGEGLKRLDYRLNEWDPKFREYLCQLNDRKPVILTGDLNVGHLDLDIHNPTAKHIVKQAGLTPEERQSFTTFVTGPFRDAFRHFYPDARGQFTYWSQRTFARPVNKGIRLDYFVVSQALLPPVVGGSEEGEVSTDKEREARRSVVDVSSWLRKDASNKKSLIGVYDSYILHEDTRGCSDHCPVVLCLAFR